MVASGLHHDQQIHASSMQKSDLLIGGSHQNSVVERLEALHDELVRLPEGRRSAGLHSAVRGTCLGRYVPREQCADEEQTGALAAVDY